MIDVHTFRGRLVFFGMLLAVPILRMVLRERYGVLRPEAILLLFVAVAVAAAIAAVARRPLAMHATAVLTMAGLTASTFIFAFLPHPRLVSASVLALSAMSAASLLFRARLYPLVVVFLAGTLLVDIGKAAIALPSAQARGPASAPGGATPRHHIIHVVLDEMIGLGSAPPDCKQCQAARAALEKTFQRDNFRTYPFAFSNYDFTRHSVLSILTNRVYDQPDKYDATAIHIDGSYFKDLAARGYAVRIYNCDFVSYAAPKNGDVAVHTYKTADINVLRELTPTFAGRFKRLLAHFIRSDQFLTELSGRALPARYQPENTWTAAIGAQMVWSRMLDDIGSAQKDTVFYAHLIAPHYPYIYAADGSIRPPKEWLSFSRQTYFPGSEAAYRQRYEVYGGQVRAVARQLEWFLERLRKTREYDSSTIIIHGDHGSRLRMMVNGPKGRPSNELFAGDYDYGKSGPDDRDLLNRFGTLLAVKPAGAVAPEVVREEGSVLHFLRRELSWPTPPGEPDENSVYLRDPVTGRYKALPMTTAWQSAHRTYVDSAHAGD